MPTEVAEEIPVAATEPQNAEHSEAVAEPETAEQQEKPETPEKPKHDLIQRRIDRLTREKYQARAELDQLRKQLEELKTPQQQRSAQLDGEPRLENFDNLVDFQRAHSRWMYENLSKEERTRREAETAKQRDAERYTSIAQNWQKSVAEAAKEIPDIREVLAETAFELQDAVAAEIFESPVGPQIAYHLALHPDELEELAGKSPGAAIRYLGRLEAKLEAENVARKKSGAPKPPTPVKGVSATVTQDPDKMSVEEWTKWRNAQIKAARG